MRLLRIAAVAMIAAVATLTTVSPAHAGGWATTLLDPLPGRLESGPTYTVGYWVLQHGSHPYEGDLGTTALVLTDEAGKTATYRGTALPERGHYATSVVFGHAGTWKLRGVQGVFAEYEIGEVSVPGGIRLAPTPTPMAVDDSAGAYWDAIRPPLTTAVKPAGALVAAVPAAAATTPSNGSAISRPLVAGVVLVAAVGVLLMGWRVRTRAVARRPARPSTGP